ncbi:hypothetical protein AOXY_G3131 [Acipenser oxyrinchus oxyrinchus]|uniref:Uncharacterized protein n=1 Tax=Acipenser oxyrinchus oxyrinchus TaxID=40147 RepID=A0AAD8GF67_ACIOX|nr:hypothetical protein AOXY_G3131 [Acipenser oxyrinchus oxyrinchus]
MDLSATRRLLQKDSFIPLKTSHKDIPGFATSSHCPKELLKPILFSISAQPQNGQSTRLLPRLASHCSSAIFTGKLSQNPTEDNHNSNSPLHRTWEVNQESDLPEFKFILTVFSKECMGGEVQYKCASSLRYFQSLESLQTHIVNGWKEGFNCRVFYQKLKEPQVDQKRPKLAGTYPT